MSAIFRKLPRQGTKSDRSASDRRRHRKKIRDSIKDNIADILSEESIIGQNRDKIIKVPIRSIKEYKFIYGDNAPGVAQSDGEVSEGDLVQKGSDGQSSSSGQAGNSPGHDIIETEISLEELTDIMFEDLELPELERKALKRIESDRRFRRKGFQRSGIRSRLDKRKSARNRIRRKLAVSHTEEEEERFPFHNDDLRYYRVKPDVNHESNAVVLCIMDTSGSMGTTKKYLARSFYFLLYQFVKLKYREVEIVFIAHHTKAKEVSEHEFFHKVESGGTYISSGYEEALRIIDERYHPSLWNVYAFHCSDGDNFYSDNEKAVSSAKKLCEVCNLFGYGEIKPDGAKYYSSSMLETYESITEDNFQTIKIEKKEDLWKGFKAFLSKDKKNES